MGLPISVNWTFSLGRTAEALRAIIGSKSAISLQRGPVDPKFQAEGVVPHQPFFSHKTSEWSFARYQNLDWFFFRFLANVNSSSCSLYVIGRPSVCRLSVTLVHPTQAIEIFGNISMPCGTLTIHDLCIKILRRSSQVNPSVGGVKHKRGSLI